jgi:LAO/AO transport system kinase
MSPPWPANLPPLDAWLPRILAGDRAALGRAITLIESTAPRHRDAADALLEAILPHSGRSMRLGISGLPGAGKSTFIEASGMLLLARGHRVAVLAVDPSSQRTGGSILGDKTRMQLLSQATGAFIRPSPAGHTLGGVARRTRETIWLCEAAGFDVVLVETVGVGQSETTVATMVDHFVVLLLAGAGDELQGIKKGIIEVADILAVHKADGDNQLRARTAARELQAALHYAHMDRGESGTRVLTCSSLTGEGLDTLWDTVHERHRARHASGALQTQRGEQQRTWLWSLLREGMEEQLRAHPRVAEHLPTLERDVALGRIPAGRAARRLLSWWAGGN